MPHYGKADTFKKFELCVHYEIYENIPIVLD